MTDFGLGVCAYCEAPAVVRVQGLGACKPHISEVFGRAVKPVRELVRRIDVAGGGLPVGQGRGR